MSMPPSKLGWMAGVIDMKGRITYKNNKRRNTHQIVLTVESKEISIVRGLGAMTGTNPELMAAQVKPDFMRRNCTSHCPDPHTHIDGDDPSMPQMGRWTITGAGMAVVLTNLLPFLTIDRGFDQAIEKATNQIVLSGQGSGMVKQSLRRLHKLGWELPIMFAAAIADEEEDDEQDQ